MVRQKSYEKYFQIWFFKDTIATNINLNNENHPNRQGMLLLLIEGDLMTSS